MSWLRQITVVVSMIAMIIGHAATVVAKPHSKGHVEPWKTAELLSVEYGSRTSVALPSGIDDCAGSLSHGGTLGHSSGSCHTLLGQLTALETLLASCHKSARTMPPPDAELASASAGLDPPPPRFFFL